MPAKESVHEEVPWYIGLGWHRVEPVDPAVEDRWETTINGHGCVVYRLRGEATFYASVRCHRVYESAYIQRCWDACYKAAHSGQF